MPPANMPPRPGGAALTGGVGAEATVRASLALFALALVVDTGGGLRPAVGTGGAPPTGPELLDVVFPRG